MKNEIEILAIRAAILNASHLRKIPEISTAETAEMEPVIKELDLGNGLIFSFEVMLVQRELHIVGHLARIGCSDLFSVSLSVCNGKQTFSYKTEFDAASACNAAIDTVTRESTGTGH